MNVGLFLACRGPEIERFCGLLESRYSAEGTAPAPTPYPRRPASKTGRRLCVRSFLPPALCRPPALFGPAAAGERRPSTRRVAQPPMRHATHRAGSRRHAALSRRRVRRRNHRLAAKTSAAAAARGVVFASLRGLVEAQVGLSETARRRLIRRGSLAVHLSAISQTSAATRAGKKQRRIGVNAGGSSVGVSRLVVAPCAFACSDQVAAARDLDALRAAAADFFAAELLARRVRVCKHDSASKAGRLTAVEAIVGAPTKDELAALAATVTVVATGTTRSTVAPGDTNDDRTRALLLGSVAVPNVYLLIASFLSAAPDGQAASWGVDAADVTSRVQVYAIRRSRSAAPRSNQAAHSVGVVRDIFAFIGPKATEAATAAASDQLNGAGSAPAASAGVILLHHLAAPVSWVLV